MQLVDPRDTKERETDGGRESEIGRVWDGERVGMQIEILGKGYFVELPD